MSIGATILRSPSTPTKAKPGRKRSSPSHYKAKSPRKSRRRFDLTPEFLSQYFHMPQKKAAEFIGVAVITVKRNCKRYKIKWPYRTNKYKAGNKPVLSEKGRAFRMLPLECMKQEVETKQEESKKEDGSDTDTESVDDDEQVKKDLGQILFSLHKASVTEIKLQL